eukprot:SAG31_NODE_8520_length_1437_cov_1.156203_2_plen_281_part_01
MSIVNLILQLTGHFHEGDLSLKSGYFYVTIVRSLSQTWALYCLVLFYHATAEMLSPIRPFPKFMAIKLVVFFTFWQAVVIDVLMELDWLPISAWRYQIGNCVPGEGVEIIDYHNMTIGGGSFADSRYEPGWNETERDCTQSGWLWQYPAEDACIDGECVGSEEEEMVCIDKVCHINVGESKFQQDVSKGIQDVLVCIEMFLAALCHTWCFTYKAHRGNMQHQKKSTMAALREMANWSDVGEHGLLGVKQIAIDSKNFANDVDSEPHRIHLRQRSAAPTTFT